ncbi:protein SHORT HYPOCOTYL IN WHITE LIGHT 1 isoform X1 [Cinnamomum micranthum f. kanehirae]|uniref:Protein SHORT HYPOCOTYL IN WHITE LIGHT 1 isoform X1 n=1 Tax=Cinnamomum micranthum f. kanehirae TaxID=337451 RepID=A0A443NWA4_9MAGN|nr:protein SHORT HYPOCOTYL IN WHITE LIGHT 1 isoform X1 [Cinnamomum micranthum f. kanehirae]
MVAIAFLLPPLPPNLPLHSSLNKNSHSPPPPPPPPCLYLTSLSSSHLFLTFPNPKTTKTTTRLPKLKGALREAAEETEQAFFEGDQAEIEEEEEEEEEESSIDLLFRFLHNLLRKMSKQAKKATRSVLPPAISPQLVSFAVDGVLLLTSLSIAKALLEVVCTLGGTVFVVILLVRLIWATVSHFQMGGNVLNEGGTFDTTQPAT